MRQTKHSALFVDVQEKTATSLPAEAEAKTPLGLLHNLLQDMASRLLLNQVLLGLKHLLAPSSTWAGRVRREHTTAFEIGVRCGGNAEASFLLHTHHLSEDSKLLMTMLESGSLRR